MNSKEKAPTHAATRAGATEMAAFGDAAISSIYPTTKKSERQVSAFLLHGQENATPLRQLVSLLGIDSRTVRGKIMAERLRGIPILSDNTNGYFLPGNEMERERFVQSMRHRAKEIIRVAAAVEKGDDYTK